MSKELLQLAITCCEGTVTELLTKIAGARRAYDHERLAFLADKLAAERARLSSFKQQLAAF
jgi:hypothetical protein